MFSCSVFIGCSDMLKTSFSTRAFLSCNGYFQNWNCIFLCEILNGVAAKCKAWGKHRAYRCFIILKFDFFVGQVLSDGSKLLKQCLISVVDVVGCLKKQRRWRRLKYDFIINAVANAPAIWNPHTLRSVLSVAFNFFASKSEWSPRSLGTKVSGAFPRRYCSTRTW